MAKSFTYHIEGDCVLNRLRSSVYSGQGQQLYHRHIVLPSAHNIVENTVGWTLHLQGQRPGITARSDTNMDNVRPTRPLPFNKLSTCSDKHSNPTFTTTTRLCSTRAALRSGISPRQPQKNHVVNTYPNWSRTICCQHLYDTKEKRKRKHHH